MNDSNKLKIDYLTRQNSYLKLLCVIMAGAIFVLVMRLDSPKIEAGFEDFSLRYNQGIFWQNETYLGCYYSTDFDLWVIGFRSDEDNQWHPIGWVDYPSVASSEFRVD